MADGRSFDDIDGFRKLLGADVDALARGLAEQLLIYATGTGIGFADRAVVEGILARTRPGGHGAKSLLLEVIGSERFRSK
jgi:hypothetical protein